MSHHHDSNRPVSSTRIARRFVSRSGVASAGTLVAAAAGASWLAVAACGDSSSTVVPASTEQSWVGEGTMDAPTPWWWFPEQTGDNVTALLQQHNARLTSIQVTQTNPERFTVTMVPDTGAYAKQWWWFPDVSMTQLVQNARVLDARVINMDSYVVNGETRHAAILISNKGTDVRQWWAVDEMNGNDLSAFIATNAARLVDWRQYTKNGQTLNSGVLVSNTGASATAWWFYPGLTQAQVQSSLTTKNAMLVSLQVADPVAGTFNVVMNQNAGIGPVTWYWGKTDAQLTPLLDYDKVRMVDLKSYELNGTRLYTTILVPNLAYSGQAASEATCDANVLASWRSNAPAVGIGSPPIAAAFDSQVKSFMQQYGLPGGAIGVVKNGKLVLARGYGFADQAGAQLAHPDNAFRLASLSKGITAAAILVAEQKGLLDVDKTHPFQILGLQPNPPGTVTSQLNPITVRDLLNHTGGFSRECGCSISLPNNAPSGALLNGTSCGATCDPMASRVMEVEGLTGSSTPPTCNQFIQYMLTQPLKWTPGAVMDYSNFGYCVLQATLEKVTGTSYASWVATNVLTPAGAANGIVPGRTIQVADHEVTYYDLPGNYPRQSVYDYQGLCTNPGQPNAGGFCVPVPYGGTGPYATGDIEAALAQGGWLSTPIDLLRLQVTMDGRRGGAALLTSASIGQLESFPNAWTESQLDAGVITINPPNPNFFYGSGFNIQPNESWQNVGSFAGTITHEYRGGNDARTDGAAGFGWVAFFNGTANDPQNTAGSQIGTMMRNAFNNAGGAGAAWGTADLFDQYGVYTSWMTASQYQAYFTSASSAGRWPSRVEGRNDTGIAMYRAYFAPFHGVDWSSRHGMDCLTYQQNAQTLGSQGFTTASLQSYVGSDGLRYYQATWVK